MTDTPNYRYLYRKQTDTGLWIEEHGPFSSDTEANIARSATFDPENLVVGLCTTEDGRDVVIWPRCFRVVLVGSEEPNGSRQITVDEGSFPREVVYSVTQEQLRDYVPNAGDWLIVDEAGNIAFEAQK